MKRNELEDAYSILSNYIHETNPFSSEINLNTIFDEFYKLLEKIKLLLKNHIIKIGDKMVISMLGEDDKMPEVKLFEKY